MSIIVTNCYDICNSPLNTSKTKQLYSFPKAKRFSEARKQMCQSSFYDLPDTRARRTTSMGYGRKFDFTKLATGAPPPTAYDVRKPPGSDLLQISFGLGRDKVKAASLFRVSPVPGPGAYPVLEGRSTIAYSIRPRTSDPSEKTSQRFVPGPGTYSVLSSVSKNGKFFYSKYRDTGASVFNPSHSKRFKNFEPRPGQYEPPKVTDPSGDYCVSRFRSSHGRSFSLAPRQSDPSSENRKKSLPGPGTYRLPSDFGHYESSQDLSPQKSRRQSSDRGRLNQTAML